MSFTEYPIHPTYKAVCEEHQKQVALAFQVMDVTSPESQYNMITEVRTAAEVFAKNYPIPETIRTKQQVFGGPKNVIIGTTVFRPMGSEEEILPVILLW
jgi:acetyl esterase